MKIILFLLLLIITTLQVFAEKIIISAHPDFPPVMFRNNSDQVIGVGAELITRILTDLGFEVENKFVGPWIRVQKDAEVGHIDLISGIYRSAKREKYLNYIPTPFMKNPAIILVKKGKSFPFNKWSDLRGKVGGKIIGDKFKPEFEDFLMKNSETITFETVTTLKANFMKLVYSRIDFIPYSKYAGLLKLKELSIDDSVEILPHPLYTGLFYLAISKKGNPKLIKMIPQIDAKIQEYIKSGYIKKLINKYLDQYEELRYNLEDSDF